MSLQKQSFVNHSGLDLNSSDLVRPDEFSSGMMNAQYNEDGSIEKRKGNRIRAATNGGFGMFTYEKIDLVTGNQTQELLSVGSSLYKYSETSLAITYSGSATSCELSLFFDDTAGVYRITITEGTTEVYNASLGTGVGLTPGMDIGALATAINGLTGFAASTSGTTTVQAAYLDLARNHDLKASALTLKAGDWATVNSPIASPFAGSVTHKNDSYFENVYAAQTSNVIYFTNGWDSLKKYDGQNLYSAGMPRPATPTGSAAGATHQFALTYLTYDAGGNIVEGNMSADLDQGSATTTLTVANLVAASGYNTNCAIVAGTQTTVTTITVDNGSGGNNTMKIGDTAYFYDGVSAGYVERTVTNRTAATITISGAAVTVADNTVISNNLRIGIYRTDGGIDKYLLAEIPNNSFAATQTFDTTGTTPGLQYLEPINDRSLPPKCKYITVQGNHLVLAGNPTNPNYVYWSDIDGPEYFPSDTNQDICQSANGDVISGIGSSNEVLVVFEQKATHTLQGDFANAQVRRETIANDIGCMSHGTIADIRGTLIFLSKFGFMSMQSGQLPQNISVRLEAEIIRNQSTIASDSRLVFNRAVGINYRPNRRYICYIPCESTSGGNVYANDNSRIFVYDMIRDSWTEWGDMNMAGGATVYANTLWFQEKHYDTATATVVYYAYQSMNRGDNWDYQDNLVPIDFYYYTNWYSFGAPSIFKKYLRIKMFGIPKTNINQFTLDVDLEKNYLAGESIGTVTMNPMGGDGYGVAGFGTDSFGDLVDPGYKSKIGPIKAKALRMKFVNSEDLSNVNITGWELEYEAAYDAQVKE